MAFSVSPNHHHSLLSPCFSACSSSKSYPKTLEFRTLALQSLFRPHISKRISRFSFTDSPTPNNGRFFRSSLAVEDSAQNTNNDDEGGQNDVKTPESEAAQIHPSGWKTLLKDYKAAIIGGDEKKVSEIEAKIYLIENVKNELIQKVSNISSEIKTGKEKYIRLQADFDNFRKRSDKERLTVRSDAQEEVIESLLPMVDSFERAKQQLKPETEKEKKVDTSYQGIYKQCVEIMRSLRVAAVGTVGKPFDPTLHEAVAREESHEFKEGIIIQEVRRGFLLGDKLLRPAMVKVSKGPGIKKPPSSATDKTKEKPPTTSAVDEASSVSQA